MAYYSKTIKPRGVLRFRGSDAIKFLQGQATCHMDLMTSSKALFGAFCNPKGRVKSTFLILQKSPDDLLMLLSPDQITFVQEQLAPYIAFFKTELTDVSADFQVLGLMDENAQLNETRDWLLEAEGEKLSVTVPQSRRRLVIIPTTESLPADWQPDDNLGWDAADITDGIVWIDEQSRESFLPHDFDLPGVGGVNFEKGCYTGQEIVARMHYRGNPKYAAAVLVAEVSIPDDLRLQEVEGPGKKVGSVITSSQNPKGEFVSLASLAKTQLENEQLRLSNGPERSILCSVSKPNLVKETTAL